MLKNILDILAKKWIHAIEYSRYSAKEWVHAKEYSRYSAKEVSPY